MNVFSIYMPPLTTISLSATYFIKRANFLEIYCAGSFKECSYSNKKKEQKWKNWGSYILKNRESKGEISLLPPFGFKKVIKPF